MEADILKKIQEMEAKIDKMYASVEKLRKYFLWTLIITVALFVLPLIGIALVIPSFMSNYVGSLNGSSLGL
jgi:hypothetical protein